MVVALQRRSGQRGPAREAPRRVRGLAPLRVRHGIDDPGEIARIGSDEFLAFPPEWVLANSEDPLPAFALPLFIFVSAMAGDVAASSVRAAGSTWRRLRSPTSTTETWSEDSFRYSVSSGPSSNRGWYWKSRTEPIIA